VHNPFGKAVFVGCARDCADNLSKVLENIERISTLYGKAAFIFVENDSRDDTKAIIQQWVDRHEGARLIVLDGLDQSYPARTDRLAFARTKYMECIAAEYSDYDHLIAMDCDIVNIRPVNLPVIEQAARFLETDARCAGVFTNQEGHYFDLWALRHPILSPGDVWEEVLDFVLTHKSSDANAFANTLAKRVFSLPKNAPPLEVDSAFGGFAIYKVSSALKNKRSYVGSKRKRIQTAQGTTEIGWQVCEHVSFNRGFRENGERLYVLPFLTNVAYIANSIPPYGFRSMVFDRPAGIPEYTDAVRLGRNDPCYCGSGKRFKHCHGRLEN
jgi:uncharacterized protein YecA (UPF0149 family)